MFAELILSKREDFFQLGFTMCKAEQPLRGMDLQEKEAQKVEPVEPVLKNLYQSNTYRKDLSWLHFDNEPRVQEKQ